MVSERLKNSILLALALKRGLQSAEESARNASAALSTSKASWDKAQMELFDLLSDGKGNYHDRLVSIDGRTYVIFSGNGRPQHVDVWELTLEEYKEKVKKHEQTDQKA